MDISCHNELSTWLLIHAHYKESIVYYFNYMTLSKRLGISHTTLRKHVKEMLRRGWCYFRDGHLCFKGLNKLAVVYQKNGLAKDDVLIPLPVCETKAQQIEQFRFVIIKNNLDKQVKKIKQKTELVNKSQSRGAKFTPKELKQIQKANGIQDFARSITLYTTLSNKRFGNLIGRATSTARYVCKKMRKNKLLKVQYNFTVVKRNVSPLEYKHWRDYHPEPFYIYDMKEGLIVKQLSNRVECVEGFVAANKL